MNRYLLAGASAIALLAGSSAANAQFKVDFSGDAWVDAAFTDSKGTDQNFADGNQVTTAPLLGTRTVQDSNSPRYFDFNQRFRFNLIAEVRGANGMEYGARYRLRAGPAGGNALDSDKAFIFARGFFGQVEYGVHSGIVDNMQVQAVNWGQGGVDGFVSDYIPGRQPYDYVSGHFVAYVGANQRTRLNYYTPRIAGLRGGFSYVPFDDTAQNGRTFALNNTTNVATPAPASIIGAAPFAQYPATGAFRDVFEFAADYSDTVGPVKVTAWAGYLFGDSRNTSYSNPGHLVTYNNLSVIAVGGRLDYAGAALSFAYTTGGNSGYRQTHAGAPAETGLKETTAWNVSAQYTIGPVIVGGQYARADAPIALGGSNLVGGQVFSTTGQTVANSSLEYFGVGATYTISQGISIRPEFGHYIQTTDIRPGPGAVSGEVEGNILILRTQVNF